MFSGISTQTQRVVCAGTSRSSPDPLLREDSVFLSFPSLSHPDLGSESGWGKKRHGLPEWSWRVKAFVQRVLFARHQRWGLAVIKLLVGPPTVLVSEIC